VECPNLGYWCLTLLATIFQWRSALLVSKIRLLANVITSTCIEYSSPWTGIELTTSVEIDIVSIVRCKSSYHTITAMVASDNMTVYNITFPYRWCYMSPHINHSFTRTMWSRSPWTVVGVPPFFINLFDSWHLRRCYIDIKMTWYYSKCIIGEEIYSHWTMSVRVLTWRLINIISFQYHLF